MWSELPTVGECVDCRPPFSFFFDMVATRWKCAGRDATPFRRICTLARKQNAQFIVVESALARADVREDIDFLDQSLGGGGAAEAVAISYFASEVSPGDINAVPLNSLLGQLVLVNYRSPGSADFTHSYVYEAVLSAPRLSALSGIALLNNFVCSDGTFVCHVSGRDFQIRGVYYCQQNGTTHVCAHACLRMGLNTILQDRQVTAKAVNNTLGIVPPVSGLTLQQVHDTIALRGISAVITDCSSISPPEYLSILASIVESGFVALLVFTTSRTDEHVVTIFGYTRNSDEWHPQALPEYSGPSSALYYPASSWIDHFLIHDDNFGPYYTLSSRAFESDPNVKAHWIIGLYPRSLQVLPHFAEANTAVVLTNVLPLLANLGKGKWFKYITTTQHKYILRTILMTKQSYIDHIQNGVAHDGSKAAPQEITMLQSLPDWFWMVEFSLPPLFTGNRSKLGEVLLDVDMLPGLIDFRELVAAVRLPELWIWRVSPGNIQGMQGGISAHLGIFQHRGHDHVW
jgi:hypothetical protein